jgi:hypothetical protein
MSFLVRINPDFSQKQDFYEKHVFSRFFLGNARKITHLLLHGSLFWDLATVNISLHTIPYPFQEEFLVPLPLSAKFLEFYECYLLSKFTMISMKNYMYIRVSRFWNYNGNIAKISA